MKPINFIHKMEQHCLNEMLESVLFEKNFEFYYTENIEKKRMPDLLGKTAKVSELQFKKIHEIEKNICSVLNMPLPDIYIYEDFYYGVESKGIKSPWIEISAKTISDFTDEEITFLIAKTLCDIKLEHTHYYTLIETTEDIMKGLAIPGAKTYSDIQKRIMYRWSRVANYTSDQFGYLVCNNLKVSTRAILLLVFNNRFIVENININEYLKQTDKINFLDDATSNFSKLDEMVPYGPFRIKNLIAFAVSNGV